MILFFNFYSIAFYRKILPYLLPINQTIILGHKQIHSHHPVPIGPKSYIDHTIISSIFVYFHTLSYVSFHRDNHDPCVLSVFSKCVIEWCPRRIFLVLDHPY